MMKDVRPNEHAAPRWVRYSLVLNAVTLAALLQFAAHSLIPFSFPIRPSPSPSPPSPSPSPQPVLHECRAPLPSFLANKPPSGAEIPLRKAFDQLDSVLQRQFDQAGIDSLSVAVVGSEGSLYEGFWGRRRANESGVGQDTTVDRNSIYRLASISKLFTALETLILRDDGVLNL